MKFWNLLLILTVGPYAASAQQTPLMQSLDCVNDYSTYTTCTWSQHEDAGRLLKMNLFYKDDFSPNLTQMACRSQIVGSQRQWNCRAKPIHFNSILNNIYVFKPDKKLEVQLNVTPINNVQPPPPQKLSIRNIEGGHFQLEWEAGDGTNRSHLLDEALDFEVSYKQIWEHWEKSPSVLVSNASHYLLRWDSLVLGSTYSARVRSQLRQDSGLSGHPSEWSSEIQWDTLKGDEAQPKNLRCLFNGIDQLNCSWEVRQEVASSVLFSLFYKANPGSAEKECYPVQATELPLNVRAPRVLQSCVITVTDRLSQYHVTVRPKDETKTMAAGNHIKPYPPYNLSVEKMDNQAYNLSWEMAVINKYYEIETKYQILYWKTNEPFKKKTQDVKDSPFFIFTPQFLETATQYRAKVRAKVARDYNGPWSEWSEEHGWETDSVLPPWILLLLVSAMIILMSLFFCCGCKYLLNKKKKWVENIPSPPRKILLPAYFPKTQNRSLDFGSQSPVGNGEISYTTALKTPPLVTPSESLGAESGKIESLSAYCTLERIKQFPLPTADVGQCTSQAGPSSPTRDCISSAKGRLAQVFDFDGPYLQCPSESPVPNIQQNVRAAPLETGKPAVSLQYMQLPPNLWPQPLPMGKKEEAAALLTAVHDWEENQHPLSTEVSRSHSGNGKLAQEGGGQRSQSRTTAKNPCQNGPLDYIATADMPLATKRSPSLLLPSLTLESSKQEESTCASMQTPASQSPQTTGEALGSELGQKSQAQPAPSRPSLEAFGDYVMTLPGTPGSAPQEGLAFSLAEPPCDKGFFLFNPDNRSPVFLQQVGDYCFFPGTKAPKGQGGSVGHSLSVTKPHKMSECIGGRLQPSPHICIDTRGNAYQ